MNRWLRGLADDLQWRMEVMDTQGGTSMLRTILSPRLYLNYIGLIATFMVLFPVGIGTFIAGLVWVVVPFAMMFAPFMYQRESTTIHFGNLRIDTLPEALLVAAAGLAILVVELIIVNAAFRFLRGKIALRIGSVRIGQ